MTRLFKKTLTLRAMVFFIIASFILAFGCQGVLASDSLRPSSASSRLGDINGKNPESLQAIIIPTLPSIFKLGLQPDADMPEDTETYVTTRAAAALTALGLRGAGLKFDKSKRKAIVKQADELAQQIYQILIKKNSIMLVHVSEGVGRDQVEAFVSNELILPDELEGERVAVNSAIQSGANDYISKSGRSYQIKHAVIDVIEGTNAFVSNAEGKTLDEMPDLESGATTTMVTGENVSILGNCPDIYTDVIFTIIPENKRKEFEKNPLDPEVTAKNPKRIRDYLGRIADANGISINDIEVVVMDRAREEERLEVYRDLQKKYPGLEITTIKDGTVAHELLTTFGRKEGKHKVAMTVGGSPEGFMNEAVNGAFQKLGAIASFRIYSKNVNTTKGGQNALNLDRRYDFSDSEKEEILKLRPIDGKEIIAGNKLFTQEDLTGDISGAFSFVTNNGVFQTEGVEELAYGDYHVNVLRVKTISGEPFVWIEEKIVKRDDVISLLEELSEVAENDQDKEMIAATLADLNEKKAAYEELSIPRINFADVYEVEKAIKGVVEVTEFGTEIISQAVLRGELIDKLVYDATFNPDAEVVAECRKLIKGIAIARGNRPDSVYGFYAAKASDPRHFTVPAINVRGMTYNTARAAFRSAIKKGDRIAIFEIAKSEIGYTHQRPAEYAASILSAAIKEGYDGKIYLQGDHFQISLKDYLEDSDKARDAIKALIREAMETGFFYQIDLDMSVLVDWSKATPDEQQLNNYRETAILTAYVRQLERELGLDRQGIIVSLGGEIGEIGMGLDKADQQNSTVEDLRAFMEGYKKELKRLSEEVGYELKPISKIAIQSGTKHGGIRDASGNVVRAKVSFNTLAELGKVAREEYGLAGVVQHGASTLGKDNFTLFAGKGVPEGFEIPEELLTGESLAILDRHPVAETHLATQYQDVIMENPAFPRALLDDMKNYILTNYPPKKGAKLSKAFVDNRKRAWGPFKPQTWNLPEDVQAQIRDALEAEFDLVFDKMGAEESGIIASELDWGQNLDWIGHRIYLDLIRPISPSVKRAHMQGDKVYPVVINHVSLLKETPSGLMYLKKI